MRLFALIAFLTVEMTPALQGSKAKTTILVSLDGVGWQFLGNNKTDTPNFDFLARTGVKSKNMITVNPTYTLPAHVTFVTGLYPESHGIVSNNFYDPDLDAEYFLDTDCSYFNPIFYQQSEPIWSTMEKKGIKTGAYFWPTSTSFFQRPSYYAEHVCIFNCSHYTTKTIRELRRRIGTNHCKFDSAKNPFWLRIEAAIRWIKSSSPPRLVLLYFDHADAKGHDYGPKSARYLKSIEFVDRHIVGYLIDRLKESNLLDTTNLIVVSDHSMVEINSEKFIDLSKAIDPSTYVINKPGIWPIGGNSVDKVLNNLRRINNSHINFYKKEDVPESLHWKHNRRIPPIYAQPEIGWSYEKRRWIEGGWLGGSHGWEPSQEMGAIFYARGPSFKEGFYDKGTLRAIDLYELLCHLVEIEPRPNNGSLNNMLHLLKGDSVSMVSRSTANKTELAVDTKNNATTKLVNDSGKLILASQLLGNGAAIDDGQRFTYMIIKLAISFALVLHN